MSSESDTFNKKAPGIYATHEKFTSRYGWKYYKKEHF